jgi:glycosyltransferase involved in cell wall biosynthesis
MLQRALSCVFGQEDVSVEVLVVDDRSADETPQRLAAIEDPRLTVIRNETPATVSRMRNLGIERARGQWVAFLDDDDVWAPQKLRSQLDAAAARSASFAYGAVVHVDPLLRVIQDGRPPPHPDRVARLLLRANFISGGCSNAIARSRLLDQAGGFDERLHVCADWDLWIRLTHAARSAAVCAPIVGYTEHAGNMRVRDTQKALVEFALMVMKHEARARAAGVHLNGLEYHRWLAEGLWRAGHRGEAGTLLARSAAHHLTARNAGYFVGRVGVRASRRVRRGHRLSEPAWIDRCRRAAGR